MVKFLGNPLEIPDAVADTQAVRRGVTQALATRVTALEGSASSLNVTSKTAAYSAVARDYVLANAVGGAFTVTLPTSPVTNTVVAVKKVDTTVNIVTVAPGAGASIDGDTSATLVAANVAATFQFDGTNWRILSTALSNQRLNQLTYQGTYSGSTAYQVDDVVAYAGSSYVAIAPTTGNLPTTSAYWGVLAAGGSGGSAVDDYYKSGYYYDSRIVNAAATNNTFATGTVWYVPWYCSGAVTIDRMGVSFASVSASCTARVGLYNAGPTGAPTTRIADFGTFTGAVAGPTMVTITGGQALVKGLYFFALTLTGATAVLYRMPAATLTVGSGMPVAAGLANTCYTEAQSALPTTSTAVSSNAIDPPLIFIRAM